MPWIVGVLVLLGFTVAFTGNRKLLYTWVVLFILVVIVGLVDFYLWEYDYGHNLDPTAPLKIPGASYQPPLIGSKQILNFKAHSWPALGGWLAFLSLIIALFTAYVETKRGKSEK